MLDKAIRIAAVEFEGKFDKGGSPYILHCLHVMNKVKYEKDEDLSIAAVLHDLVEDTDWTLYKLLDSGFSKRSVELIDILTHEEILDTYDAYIKKIGLNRSATKIKIHDLRHNSDIMRMKGLREKDFKRLEKYHKAYAYLTS